MEIPKEEKRKLKTFQLNNKENFVYYLYQLNLKKSHAMDLVWRVFLEFEAPDYSDEGIKE